VIHWWLPSGERTSGGSTEKSRNWGASIGVPGGIAGALRGLASADRGSSFV
jgi:hypothetical protein